MEKTTRIFYLKEEDTVDSNESRQDTSTYSALSPYYIKNESITAKGYADEKEQLRKEYWPFLEPA